MKSRFALSCAPCGARFWINDQYRICFYWNNGEFIGIDELQITNSTSKEHAEDIVAKVTAQNGNTIVCGEHEFPVNVHIGAFQNTER